MSIPSKTCQSALSAQGFSLLELVITIVVLGIAAVAILSMFGQAVHSLAINENIQTAAQAGQSCGEHILATKRRYTFGFSLIDSAICDALPTPSGLTRSVTITDPYTGSACPGGAACKEVHVVITQDTKTLVDIPLLLARY